MQKHLPKRVRLLLLALVTVWHAIFTVPLHSAEAERFSQVIEPAFHEFCLKCHGTGVEIAGELNLSKVQSADLQKDTEMLRRLIDVLDFEEMPPEDEPQPDANLRRKLVLNLKEILHNSFAKHKTYSHAPVRRMNRFQYNNAVTDLFDLRCVVFTLPERMVREHNGYFMPSTGKMADSVTVGSRPLGKSQLIEPRLAGVAAFPQDLRAEHGFDNRGDHLSLSPLLMEAFLKLGQTITQSPDFVQKNVGIWKSFFEAPAANSDTEEELRMRLSLLLMRAFRRPVEEHVLNRYIEFVNAQLEAGIDFTEAMRSVAAAVIASPKFLYLYDKAADTHTAEPIDDFELASRLSFFLWGSLPDQTLLKLASTGELKEPETLTAEVSRMLMDRRIKRFCDSFPAQWLQLERIISAVPNRDRFPDFYFSKYRDSMHMMIEPLLLFETVLIENQPITQFIDSDFTYRSTLLEKAYGSLGNSLDPARKGGSGVTVLNFHRVPVVDRRTGGLITNAAVMTMTSGPERTQPITRGAWIATVIFNNPPEPPPADVPALEEKPPEGQEHLTLRERLAMHRQRADCNGCHEQIDPLGFALENFNPIGVWRNKYENGRDVDMAGELFRRHSFSDVVEFKDAVLAEKDRFTRGLAGHLLSFALARELGASDKIALDRIAAATAADNYKIHTLLKQVVLSEPFLTKTNPRDERN